MIGSRFAYLTAFMVTEGPPASPISSSAGPGAGAVGRCTTPIQSMQELAGGPPPEFETRMPPGHEAHATDAETAYEPDAEPEGDVGPESSEATIIEFCCGNKSRSGHDYGNANKWRRVRLTINDDLTTSQRVARAREEIQNIIKSIVIMVTSPLN